MAELARLRQQEWLTLREYAVLFRVHPNTVLKWRQHGLLTILRIQRTVRVKNQPPRTNP